MDSINTAADKRTYSVWSTLQSLQGEGLYVSPERCPRLSEVVACVGQDTRTRTEAQ